MSKKSEPVFTNFNEQHLAKIQAVLDFVDKNKYSDFYHKKYQGIKFDQITSFEQFSQKIPTLKKDAFLSVLLADRIFVPDQEIERYSFSSGTTGQGKIAVIPQGKLVGESMSTLNHAEQLLKEKNITKMLVMWPITSSAFARNMRTKREGIIVVPGDVHRLKFSATLMVKLKIDAIDSTATILEHFIDELSTADFDFSEVKWISLGGEFCSSQKRIYFQNIFPNASINFRFGSSELGGRGYRCKFLDSQAPNIFHPSPFSLIEIEKNSDCQDNFGEIIHTTLSPHPFPFIRYRTGDVGKLEKTVCECGAQLLLTVYGRTSFDVLKISGLTIYSELIADAVFNVQDVVEPRFQMHVFEQLQNNKPKIKFELHLKLKPHYADSTKNEMLKELIKEKISSSLQLSNKMTLSMLVEKVIVCPLEIVFVNSWDSKEAKTKNIISHLE